MRVILDKQVDELAETFLPYVVSVTITAVFAIYFWDRPLPAKIDKSIESSINIFSILVGFLGAALAIVFAIDNKPVVLALKKKRQYCQFLRYFFEATAFSFAALAVSFFLNGAQFDNTETWAKWVVTLWCFVVCSSAMLSLRVTWLLFRILHKNSAIEEGAEQ